MANQKPPSGYEEVPEGYEEVSSSTPLGYEEAPKGYEEVGVSKKKSISEGQPLENTTFSGSLKYGQQGSTQSKGGVFKVPTDSEQPTTQPIPQTDLPQLIMGTPISGGSNLDYKPQVEAEEQDNKLKAEQLLTNIPIPQEGQPITQPKLGTIGKDDDPVNGLINLDKIIEHLVKNGVYGTVAEQKVAELKSQYLQRIPEKVINEYVEKAKYSFPDKSEDEIRKAMFDVVIKKGHDELPAQYKKIAELNTEIENEKSNDFLSGLGDMLSGKNILGTPSQRKVVELEKQRKELLSNADLTEVYDPITNKITTDQNIIKEYNDLLNKKVKEGEVKYTNPNVLKQAYVDAVASYQGIKNEYEKQKAVLNTEGLMPEQVIGQKEKIEKTEALMWDLKSDVDAASMLGLVNGIDLNKGVGFHITSAYNAMLNGVGLPTWVASNTPRKVLDSAKKIYDNIGVKPPEEMQQAIEKELPEMVSEGIGGIVPVVVEMAVANKALGAIGLTNWINNISKSNKALGFALNVAKEEALFQTIFGAKGGVGAGFKAGSEGAGVLLGAIGVRNPILKGVMTALSSGMGGVAGEVSGEVVNAAYQEAVGSDKFKNLMEQSFGDYDEASKRILSSFIVFSTLGIGNGIDAYKVQRGQDYNNPQLLERTALKAREKGDNNVADLLENRAKQIRQMDFKIKSQSLLEELRKENIEKARKGDVTMTEEQLQKKADAIIELREQNLKDFNEGKETLSPQEIDKLATQRAIEKTTVEIEKPVTESIEKPIEESHVAQETKVETPIEETTVTDASQLKPVIEVNGNKYYGENHGEAMENAIKSGEKIPSPETEEGKVWREENGKFEETDGKILTRDETENKYGIRRSEDIPIKEEIKFRDEKDFIQWAKDNATDPNDIKIAYDLEMSQMPIESLNDWQRAFVEMGSVGISSDSFNRFGDVNNIDKGIARKYLRKNGKNIDTFILEDLAGAMNAGEEQYLPSPSELAEFMSNMGGGRIRKTSDTGNELRKRYREITGKTIEQHENKINSEEELAGISTLNSLFEDNKKSISDFKSIEEIELFLEENKNSFDGFPYSQEDYLQIKNIIENEKSKRQQESEVERNRVIESVEKTPIESTETEQIGEQPPIEPPIEEPVIDEGEPIMPKSSKEVVDSFNRQREKIESNKKSLWTKIKEGSVKHFTDIQGIAKRKLRDAGFLEAVRRKALEQGSSAVAKEKVKEFYDKIFKGLKKSERKILDDIIQARRDISVDKRFDEQGKKRPKHLEGNTKESYEQYLNDLETSNPKLYAKLNERADRYFDAYREMLKIKLDEGRISQEVYDSLINNEYEPRKALSHLMDAEYMGSQSHDNSVGHFDIKNIKEGTEGEYYNNARWLLETSTLQTYRTIFKNRTDRALYNFAEKTPDNGLIEIQKSKGISEQTGQPIYDEAPTGYTQIQFFDNGVKKSMIMSNEIAKDWIDDNAIRKYTVPNIIRMLTGGSILRSMATGVNPVFALSNLPKDFVHSLFATEVYSTFLPKAIGQLGRDVINVSKDVFKRKGRYKEYIDEGGGMEFLTHQGKVLESGVVERNKLQMGLDAAQHVIGYINESSELIVRVAIREQQIKNLTEKFVKQNGRQPNESELKVIKEMSTSEARDQMDFSRGGDWVKFVDQFIPYTNAGFQGFNSFVRAAKRNPKVFAAKVAQIGTASIALYLYNKQYDDYEDISPDIKARNFIIMLPFTKTNEKGQTVRQYISIPKALELSAVTQVFDNVAQLATEGKVDKEVTMKSLKTSIPTIDPLAVPVLDASWTYISNYDRFKDSKVWYGGKDVLPEDEYNENTSEMFKILGEQFGFSPIRAEAAISKITTDPKYNIYTIGIGKMYNAIRESISDEKDKKELDKSFFEHIDDMFKPFKNKYLRETNPDFTKYKKEEEERINKLKAIKKAKKSKYSIANPPRKI